MPRSCMSAERMGNVVAHCVGALYPVPVDRFESWERQPNNQLYDVYDHKSRPWRIKLDGRFDLELNTPPMEGKDDLDLFQCTAAELARAGARFGPSNGLHLHIDAPLFLGKWNETLDCSNLTSLLGLFYKYQKPLYAGFQVRPGRIRRFCQPLERAMIEKLQQEQPKTRSELYSVVWNHPGWTRYKVINIRDFREHETFEGRFANATGEPVMIAAFHGVMTGMVDTVLAESKKPAAERVRFDESLMDLPQDNAVALRDLGELIKLDPAVVERLIRNARTSDPRYFTHQP